MSNDSGNKVTRSERRKMAKRKQQMQSIGMMIIGVLVIVGAVVIISVLQPGLEKAENRDYSLENMNAIGEPDAPVVVEIYSSFACIHCKNFSDEAEGALFENYVNTGKILLVYRSFNGNADDPAGIAGQAAYCAGDQDAFWKMHDTIFANYSSSGYTQSQLTSIAKSIDLNQAQFNDCLSSRKYADTVLQDFEIGVDLGITGTPSFTINGEVAFKGNTPYEDFAAAIDQALATANN
ncbi:MAG TPA: DsbA family protein [Anaerolineales bacterium]|nr:DsbA family protein [Anaerolineales bacterium]